MKIKIMQFKTKTGYRFMDYEWAKKHGFNLKDYTEVYETFTELWGDDIPTSDLLEALFLKFNVWKPEDFKGHSLSTSDVIIIGEKAYYCDTIGWAEIA